MSKNTGSHDRHRTGRGPSPVARQVLWLAVYYAVLLAVLVGLWAAFPELDRLFADALTNAPTDAAALTSSAADGRALGLAQRSAPHVNLALLSSMAMLGALALTIPVAWVYLLTRRKKGFMQSLAHTLVILPIAVAGVVVLVQDSLALAFSLAGIAAAVRFRNTLEDTKDAVYIFLAIGIGISAALGALAVGVVMSFVFSAATLLLWWTDFGRRPMRLEAKPARDPATGELSVVDGGEDAQGRFTSLLRVHVMEVDQAQREVEALLEENADRWELVGLMPGESGLSRLDYLVRLRRKGGRGALLNTLRSHGSPHLVGVEFASQGPARWSAPPTATASSR